MDKVKNFLLGRPLRNEELSDEKLSVFWGLPIMASDAISSVAYAVEEILWVLVLVVGLAAYRYMFFAAIAIVALLLILVFSYRQTIDNYPNGGGAYTVARENLGEMPGMFTAAALIIDYILTVAVSTSAGTAAVTSAIPALLPFRVWITLFLILIMTIGNLRGVKESARAFAIPTYIFIVSVLAMIVTGIVKIYILHEAPVPLIPIPEAVSDMTFLLFLRAFAVGCSGLTGVEAVSNAIPNFKEPSQRHAKQVLSLLALCVLLIFGGTSFLATQYHAVPTYHTTVLSQIASQVFGGGVMYYVLQVSTAVILVMAANTSYAGLPMLLALVATDGYAPRQLSMRGGRLGFSNGILVLSAVAGLLVVLYKAETHHLIPLYAVGVFISFTVSQLGMFMKWYRSEGKGRFHKMLINGIGALLTLITVISIAYTKMAEGAWITLVMMLVLVLFMRAIRSHYDEVAQQLKLTPEDVQSQSTLVDTVRHTIVIISTLNKASLRAINYARRLSDDHNIVAFNVSVDEARSQKLREHWERCGIPVPLTIKYSPYREIIAPLIEYIESEEHASTPNDMITLVMPQFVVSKPWQNVLHNQTAFLIRHKLLHNKRIAVITVPYVLDK